jgi:hypothetical protein
MKQTLYLSGPDMLLGEGQFPGASSQMSWRSAAFHFCIKYGIQVINPLTEVKGKVNSNGKSFIADDRTRKEVEVAHSLIDRSDFILTNLYSPDESSWIPLTYAHGRGKHTIAWTPFPVSPWLVSYVKASFENLQDALEYLVKQVADDQRSLIDWSLQYEHSLRERSDKFPSEGDTDFQFFPGDGKNQILLLAPHSTSYWHLGSLEEAESYTGALAACLSRLSGCMAVVSSFCSAEDSLYTFPSHSPLRPTTNPLIGLLQRVIKKNKTKLAVIIRGQSWRADRSLKVSIYPSSAEGSLSEVSNTFIGSLANKAQARNMSYSQNISSQENELSRLASFLDADIIELSVHKSYLIPHLQRAQYHSLITMLEEVIDET